VSDDEALRAIHAVRPLMQRSAEGGGHLREPWVFERHGRPCRRCGTTIRARGQGDDNRTSYWCPQCQA
jgi:endonuclease-8